MLNQVQSREYTRFKTLWDFFNDADNIAIYSGFKPFADEVADYMANFSALDALTPNKSAVATGITEDKTTVKHKVSDGLAVVCRKSKFYALKFNNGELAAEMSVFAENIFRKKDSDILPFALHVQSLLTPLIGDANFDAYGVTAVILQGLVKLAMQFNGMIGQASVKQSTNTVADTAINDAIRKLTGNLTHFDLLIDEFAEGNAGFVEGYHINSELVKAGVRHSGISGVVTDKEGNVLANAKVQLDGTDKNAVTDLKGAYVIERVPPGDYTVRVSAGGFADKSVVHHVSRGRIDEVDWVMG